ncbi:hypothetical protein [Streptacidiphilus sp. MAP12-16]|uniref:hypothetical protein n=1 Tax=Streptacidiphilus sp. MAP12-16 TaxID=3156300 RepID=UPI003516EB58
MEELPESVDRDILEKRTISALRTIRESQGCSLHEALDLLQERFQELQPELTDRVSEAARCSRVLRFEPDGSLVVIDGLPEEQKPKK